MQKLTLFDIDKTLLTGAENHRRAFTLALKEVYGVNASVQKINYSGMTDPTIIAGVLSALGFEARAIDAKLAACQQAMVDHFAALDADDGMRLLGGVRELLGALHARGVVMGLATGNLEPIAWRKLEKLSIDRYFSVGGFASDHGDRSVLAAIALRRARERHGAIADGNAFLFGDTPQDVIAGNSAGIMSVGVATGSYSSRELNDAGAAYTLDNLKDLDAVLAIVEG